jgi:hypothetical protein
VGACVLIVYLAVLYGTYVPDWQFTVQNGNNTVELTVSFWFLLSHSFKSETSPQMILLLSLYIVGDVSNRPKYFV